MRIVSNRSAGRAMKRPTHAFALAAPLRLSKAPALTTRRTPVRAPVRCSVATTWGGAAAAGLLGIIFGFLSTNGGGSQCETCGGAGYLPCSPCGACGGSGRRRCPRCRGGGTGVHANVAREAIPVRIEDGFRFKRNAPRLATVGGLEIGGAAEGGT